VPFGRLGVATDAGSQIKRVLDAGGVNVRPSDAGAICFGASVNLTDPSHGALHHESLFETFYRVRVTQSLELGPDLEISIPPTNSRNQHTTALLGLRMRVIF
jgi:porin